MARRPTKTQQARFRSLIAGLEPAMRRAFQQAVAGLYAGINWTEFLEALRLRDVERAVAALNIDDAAFTGLYQSHQAAFMAGAQETVATLGIAGVSRKDAIGIRFDMTNPRAEGLLATTSSAMVQQISEDTRNAVRETILSGYTQGRGPRDIATDIAGRVVGGRRQGGVLGLDANRAHRWRAITEGIRTADGVRDLVIRHRDGTLGLRYVTTPDIKRRILAAYKRGEPVSIDGQRIIGDRYRNALLKHRADTVAQVETAQAVMAGRCEEWQQVLTKLGRSPDDVEKKWQHGSGGKDPRPTHVAMNDHVVRGLDTPFVFSDGATLQYAHDPNGAAKDVIRCTCSTDFRLVPDLNALR